MPSNHTITLNRLKIIIHDLKTSQPDPEKTKLAQSYINKAIQIGISHDQIGSVQQELDKIQYATPTVA